MRRRRARRFERERARVTATCRRLLFAAAALLAARGAAAEAGACEPWPREPAPLPTIASTDPVLARWAALREAELTLSARDAEAGSPANANRLWRHALCLDPGSGEAKSGLDRTRLVRVYRPAVVAERGAAPGATAAEFSQLGDPIRVASREPRGEGAAPSAAAPDWARVDAALRNAETKLREADFEAALAGARRVGDQLRAAGSEQGARERRARADVVAATAQVALGRDDEARHSFERALAADPALRLDPATTSPKVRRAFDAARAAKGGAQ